MNQTTPAQALSGMLPSELPQHHLPDRVSAIENLRREVFSQTELSPLVEIFSHRDVLAPSFVKLIGELHAQLLEEIPVPTVRRIKDKFNSWSGSKSGVPEKSEELEKWLQQFPERFNKLDPFARALTHEVFTLAAEILRYDGIYAGRRLFPHQQALFTWFGMALVSSVYAGRQNRLFLLDSPHGTGKTELLGMINTAAFNANVRNDFPYITAYVASRGFSGGQQVVGLDQVSRLVTHAYPDKFTEIDLNEMLRHFSRALPAQRELFRFQHWRDFLATHDEGFASPALAQKAINDYFKERGTLRELGVSPQALKQTIEDLSLWFSHQAALVRKNDRGEMLLLRFPKMEPIDDERAPNRYCGDIVRGLPDDVSTSGLIYSPRFPNSALQRYITQQKTLRDGDEVVKRCYLAVLSEHDAHLGKRRTQNIDLILNQASLLLIDEAGKRSGSERQAIVSNPAFPPIVVSSTYTKSRMPVAFSYDAVSPQPSLVRAFEQGILPAMAEGISPNASEVHVSYRTKESIDAIVEDHFTDYPLYRELSLPQPYRGRTIIVVEKAMTVAVADALRAEYAKRGIEGVVVPISVNTGSSERDKFMSRALAWMVSWKNEAKDGNPPFAQVLVSQAGAVIDGLNIPDINVTIADPKAMSHDSLVRLAMRAARGHHPQKPNSAYRGLVKTLRFLVDGEVVGATFSNTVSSVLNPSFDKKAARASGQIELLQAAVALPAALAKKEAEIARRAGIVPETFPATPAAARLLAKSESTEPFQEEVVVRDDTRQYSRLLEKERPLAITEISVGTNNFRKFQIFASAVARKAADWEDVDHAMTSSIRLLPEEWIGAWRANQRENFEFVRSRLYSACDHHAMNSAGFALRVADAIAERVGIFVKK